MTIIRKLVYLLVGLSLLATAGWLLGAPAQFLAHTNISQTASAVLLIQALATSFVLTMLSGKAYLAILTLHCKNQQHKHTGVTVGA